MHTKHLSPIMIVRPMIGVIGSKPELLYNNSAHPELVTGIIYLFFHAAIFIFQEYTFGIDFRDHSMLF